jgi:hypothetical protein
MGFELVQAQPECLQILFQEVRNRREGLKEFLQDLRAGRKAVEVDGGSRSFAILDFPCVVLLCLPCPLLPSPVL